MPLNKSVDTTIFDKKPNFMGIFLVTSIIGIILITLAVYRASSELEIIHEVDNTHRLVSAMLGEEKLSQIMRAGDDSKNNQSLLAWQPDYRFFIISEQRIQAMQKGTEDEARYLSEIDLESTRMNQRGGFFSDDDKVFTWTTLASSNSNKKLLVVHTFKSEGNGALAFVYKKRIIIPVFFYIWLMVWVSLIFNHLMKKLKKQQAQLKRMALHDALTGLPNRSLMDDRLGGLIKVSKRENKKFALALFDIDAFKTINDNYGHAYGDELLRQVAKRLEGVLRESDTAARIGGDEFTIMLHDIDETTWHDVFERIFTTLVGPYTLLNTIVRVNVSMGVTIYSVHGKDVKSLLHQADKAMYKVKAAGGGMCIAEHLSNYTKTESCVNG